MTKQEAIECMQYLYEHQHSMIFKSLVDKESREKIAAGVTVAKTALQECIEREKGCEYCLDEFCPQLVWAYGLDHLLPDFKYCPMCGRKLKGANNDCIDALPVQRLPVAEHASENI